MRDTRVVVVGGGFAGIAAASRLHARGARVTLLDDRTALGGRARSDELDGWTIDVGAQLIATSYARTLTMLRADGHTHGSRLNRMPGRDLFLRDGRAYPINFGSMRSLLAFGAIGPADKVRLGLHLVPLLARHRDALRADATVPAALDDRSASDFIRETVSDQAATALVEPVSAAFCGARGTDMSLGFYLTLGHYGSEGEMLAPPGGWTALLDSAIDGVTVHRNSRVTSIVYDGATVTAGTNDGRWWEGEAAVIATDAQAAAGLLGGIAGDELIAWLSGLQYRPSFTVAVTVRAPLPHEAFGMLVHNDGRFPVGTLAVHGAKVRHSSHPGDVVLAWPTPDAAARLSNQPAGAIASAMVPAVESLIPSAAGRIGHVRVYRHAPGIPSVAPGFGADRVRGRALARSIGAPIALAGDYLTMPLLEGAVASGEDAAEWLASRLDQG